MNDQTIMPDGRPLSAWRIEIDMNRADRKAFQAAKKELAINMHLLHVVSIEQERDYHNGDYLFRIRRADAIVSTNDVQVLENASITRI